MDTALAPAFVDISYTGLSGLHHKQIPVNIVSGWTAGTEPQFTTKGGTTGDAGDLIDNLVDVWRGLLAESQNIGLAQVIAVNSTTGEGTFVWGYNVGQVGAHGGDGVELGMATLSLKLVNGRIGRDVTMEGWFGVNSKLFPPFVPASELALWSGYLTSDASIFYGRGNAYPFAPISLTTKSSDALRVREGLG
jgi:hypothetical protein